MPLALDRIEVAVHDREAYARAYAPAGLARDDDRIDGGPGAIALLPSAGPPLPDRLRACVAGIAHVCLQTVEPDRVWRALAERGMRWNAEPVGLGTGYTYAYGYDLEGNLVELEGTGEPRFGRTTWLAHAAIVTPDMARSRAFYEALIGTPAHASGRYSHPNMGRVAALEAVDARAAWIATPGLDVELWEYVTPPTEPRPPERPTGYRRLVFACRDLAAETARLAGAGIAVEPEGGGLAGRDPDGNAVRIVTA